MNRLLSAAAAVALSAAVAPASEPTAVNVAYFVPNAPGVIRFNVTLDGKPAEEVWTKAAEALFAFVDRNGDGHLDEAERAALARPTGRTGRRTDPTVDVGSELAGRLTFEKNVEKVDKATFLEALKTAGFGPVNVQFQSGRADSGPLTAALFRHLDANGDGKLSADELAAARERLEFLDVNEDEWLTTPELLARAVTATPRRFVAPGMRNQEPEPTTTNPNDLLTLNGQSIKAVKQLLAARGKAKATTLGRTEMGMGEKLFQQYDRDGNGQLDTDELLAWLKQPPLLTVTLDLHADAAKSTVKPRGVELVTGSRFDVAAPVGTSAQEWAATASQLRAAFKEAAKDGVVEKDKLKDQPALLAAFPTLDRNADGKLDEKELAAVLDALAPLAVCRADVAIVDQGRGLFEIVDGNGDGQLSARELAEMPRALKPFLAADGGLEKAGVPRSFPVRAAANGIRVVTVAQLARDAVAFAPAMEAPRPVVAPKSAPAWFVKMDRNNDGDVSRKEFLGPLELFRKLDADGDGLISAAEAAAAKE